MIWSFIYCHKCFERYTRPVRRWLFFFRDERDGWGGVTINLLIFLYLSVVRQLPQSFLSSISSLNFINPTTNLSQPGLPLILSVIHKSNATYTRHINWHRDFNKDRARRVQLVVNATPSELCTKKSRAKNTKWSVSPYY